LGLTNEPIYKQIALIQCVKLQQAEQIAKLNIILYHRENGLSHPDFKPEIEISKQAERIEELISLIAELIDIAERAETNDFEDTTIELSRQALKENEHKSISAQGQTEPVELAEHTLVCKCGWYGTVEQQDVLGSEYGCCPDCGNEDLIWLSDLIKKQAENEKLNKILKQFPDYFAYEREYNKLKAKNKRQAKRIEELENDINIMRQCKGHDGLCNNCKKRAEQALKIKVTRRGRLSK